MIVFVIFFDAQKHFIGVLNRRFFDLDRLETAFKRGVFFNVFAVFVKGRSTDHLNLAAGKRRLHDIRSVHRALGVARSDQVVHFVDKQDNIALGLHFVDKPFNPAFKLPAELCSGDQRREV